MVGNHAIHAKMGAREAHLIMSSRIYSLHFILHKGNALYLAKGLTLTHGRCGNEREMTITRRIREKSATSVSRPQSTPIVLS